MGMAEATTRAMATTTGEATITRYGYDTAAARRGWPRSTTAACRRARRESSPAASVGKRLRERYSYQQIPYSVRRQYNLNTRYRYYYNNGYLYQVDPRTLLVQQVINAILR